MTAARACVLLMAAVLVAYANALQGVFQFDDYAVIVDNTAVHSWSGWWWSMPGIRPLLKASYTLSWTLGGGTLAFHAFNIACHAASACLVFVLVRRWSDASPVMPPAGAPHATRDWPLPLAVALIFALHPAQTEVVTYLSGRSSGLMALLYLAALWSWERVRNAGAGSQWPSLVLFAAALATKETAWTLPFALILVEFTRNGGRWRAAWAAARAHFALLAMATAAILALPQYRRMLAASVAVRDPLENLVAQVSGVTYLIAGPLVSLELNVDPEVPVLHGLAWWGACTALAALLWAGIAGVRRGLLGGFGLLWFFLQLLPTNSLLARYDLANDRQLDLALVGAALTLCVWARARMTREGFVVAAIALAAVLGVGTAWRNHDYRSEVALWEATLATAPHNARAWNNLGLAYRNAGDRARAQVAFERALALDPGHYKAAVNLILLDRDPPRIP